MSLLHGFDVSAFQGGTVPSADFVFVKATEGSSYTSSKFAAQWASAKTRAKVRGAYHFARPEESSGASQADRFLSVVKPGPRDVLILDLEASKLSQAETNAFARDFADRCKAKAPDNTRVIYMGGGYASNGTGRGLNQHFSFWWYPQYPSTAATSTWRTSFAPWLPSGLTCGWSKPHIWQWTDNFNGLDANISTIALDELRGSKPTPTPTPTPEEDQWFLATST
jgi:Lyzozyme M1 (1,4-beta-N-acetylmuramidase)